MEKPRVIRVSTEVGTDLLGRTRGRHAFSRFCESLMDARPGELILFDFTDVRIVTASWVNAALIALARWSASDSADLYLALSNVSEEALDEVRLVAENANHCFLVTSGSGKRKARIVGHLDVGQQDTLAAVIAWPGVTGAELERKIEGIKATAWNNRLKDLNCKRLLRRERRGRERVYSPVFKEMALDG